MPLAAPILHSHASKKTKRQMIYDSLVEQITSGGLADGAKLPSATDLTNAWRVSYVTVHSALSDLTRDGWLVRYPKHGTFVSSRRVSPPGGRSATAPATALLFLPHHDEIVTSGNGPLVFETIQGLTLGAQEAGWQLQIRPLPTCIGETVDGETLEAARHVSAVLFVNDQYRFLRKQLCTNGRLVLSLYGEREEGIVLTYDRAASIELGVGHLLGHGCRNIAFFGNESEQKRSHFAAALAGKQHAPAYYAYPGGIPGIEPVLKACLKEPLRHDGMLFAHYPTAIRFAQAVRARGIAVPQQVRVVAIGMNEAILPEQRLPCVRIPYLEIGREAMRLLASGSLPPLGLGHHRFTLPPVLCDLPDALI